MNNGGKGLRPPTTSSALGSAAARFHELHGSSGIISLSSARLRAPRGQCLNCREDSEPGANRNDKHVEQTVLPAALLLAELHVEERRVYDAHWQLQYG